MIPPLSIVIPSHHRPDLLRACLGSVLRHSPPHTEVMVVDDASPDRSVGLVAAEFAGVCLERLEHRGGLCHAANAGLPASPGEVVERRNEETEVCPGCAEAALEAVVDAWVGAV